MDLNPFLRRYVILIILKLSMFLVYIIFFYTLECGVDDEKFKILCQSFKETPKLEEIDLYINNITSVGCKYLADSFKYIKKLKLLYLGKNYLQDEGFKFLLDEMSNITKLEELSLYRIFIV